MSDPSEPPDTERAARLDSAIAESQRLEREEREADLAKQRSADERIVRALAQDDDESV